MLRMRRFENMPEYANKKTNKLMSSNKKALREEILENRCCSRKNDSVEHLSCLMFAKGTALV